MPSQTTPLTVKELETETLPAEPSSRVSTTDGQPIREDVRRAVAAQLHRALMAEGYRQRAASDREWAEATFEAGAEVWPTE